MFDILNLISAQKLEDKYKEKRNNEKTRFRSICTQFQMLITYCEQNNRWIPSRGKYT